MGNSSGKKRTNVKKGTPQSAAPEAVSEPDVPLRVPSLLAHIRDNIIGWNATFDGPFGTRKVIYCDFVASGKPVRFIEDFISQRVHPYYANTHTTTSVCSLQTSTFREEARQMIKTCVNATDDDVLIFCGSGATSAIHKLLVALGLWGEQAKKTTVIIGPYEHHSNILPWRECGTKVLRLPETLYGLVDIEDLKKKLESCRSEGHQTIVSLSAASNVTGILTDTVTISELAHSYGALIFWDYACAGPYVDINMNRSIIGLNSNAGVAVLTLVFLVVNVIYT